jgi:hypothetical protein
MVIKNLWALASGRINHRKGSAGRRASATSSFPTFRQLAGGSLLIRESPAGADPLGAHCGGDGGYAGDDGRHDFLVHGLLHSSTRRPRA